MDQKSDVCQYKLMASRDALEVIQGKWRLPIIIALSYGAKRFGEIQHSIGDISPKMLSQELKALELNQLIIRKVYHTTPVVIEYSLSPLGASTQDMLDAILNWGIHFRTEVLKQTASS